jgi:hypothetical protein
MPAKAKTGKKTSSVEADHFFGEFLVSKGLISHRELIEALNVQRNQGGRLGEVLLRLKMLDGSDVACSLAEHLSLEYVSLDDAAKIDMKVARILPESIAKRFCLVAIGEIDNRVMVAMADPLNVVAIDTIALKIKRQIKVGRRAGRGYFRRGYQQ